MYPETALLNTLVHNIVNACHPIKIILFGSAAKGEMNENSDLDVLIVMPNGTHRRKTAQSLYRHLLGFGFAKDIIVATEDDINLFRSDPFMVYKQALSEGKELYHVQ